MTPDKIALDVVRQLRWDNDTRWHEIIAAAIAAERERVADAESRLTLSNAASRRWRDRAEKAEAERDEALRALQAVAMDAVAIGRGENAISDDARGQVEVALAIIDKEPGNG